MTFGMIRGLLGSVALLVLVGCGTAQHKSSVVADFKPAAATKIDVGDVVNSTKETFDIDIVKMMQTSLTDKLRSQSLLAAEGSGQRLTIVSTIVEYSKGNAFARWLVPGLGATILTVRCKLLDGTREVGSVDATRNVFMGGGYSIGTWKTIFDSIASDVVTELRSKLPNT